ncbi:uncharacterized protein LOC119373982 [Rhipicephalus sanguineus]|uniref:uncharacterized protein LOC119373982 n=1 Tax=Rhipicephalus sanguineus TaxID=34632 RepID=UPI00189354EE|nr:uncharacterized protein LOC119373982 [Rhipicephalus sanguineus]
MTLLWIRCAFYFCYLTAAIGTIDDGKYSSPYEAFSYEDANMILKYNGTMRLFRTSRTWTPLIAMCLKSRYISKNGSSYLRTADYYAVTKVNRKPTIKHFNLTLQVTPRLPGNSQGFITVKGIEQKPDLPSALGSLLLNKERTYPVLFADPRCLIIGYYSALGRSFCMLFVTDEALRNPLRHCNFMLLSMCGTPAYNAYTYEHHVYAFCNASDGHRTQNIV